MKKFIPLMMLIFLMGCASPEFIKFDDQNMANSIIAAQQIKKNWEANSEFIKVVMGVGLDDPSRAELKASILALDKITAKPDPLTKKDVGGILGWFGRFVVAGTQSAYDKIMPIILKIIAAAS